MTAFLADDFTGSALRADLWTVGVVTGNPYNNGGYIDASQVIPNPSRSTLRLAATVNPSPPDANHPYLVGVVRSKSFQFGSVRVRARMPKGKGVWPALWMLPASNVWPPEVDLVEVLGSDPTVGYCNYHSTDTGDGSHKQALKQFTGTDLSAGFHTYGVDWSPGALTFTFDGAVLQTTTNAPAEPMYLLLSMQVGLATSWGGAPDATTVFPQYLDIDWVTVVQ